MLRKLKNPDGTFNGKIVAGVISLLIVLTYQIANIFGFQFRGQAGDIADLANTILAILGLIGVLENPGTVQTPTKKGDKANG